VSSPPAHEDLEPLVENWWMMATRGVLAVLFGCVMAVWRVPVLDAVTLPFAAYAVADGVLAFASALRAGRPRPRMAGWPVVSIGLGGLSLAWPFLPRTVFVVLVAWGLLTGVLEIAAVLRLPRDLPGHWLLATGGGSSLFLALVVLALTSAASDLVARVLAAYAVVRHRRVPGRVTLPAGEPPTLGRQRA
jgi:uncharacterized membrane protein HdeD (DUF308 family)